MPVGFSTGETYDTEFDYLADRPMVDSSTEPTARITVAKREDEQQPIIKSPRADTNIPSAVRLFADTVLGNKEDIDESYFTQAELDRLYNIADKQISLGKNSIGYGQYGEKDPWADGTQAVINALTDPAQSLAFSLGMANVSKDSTGNITVTDRYHWAASKEKVDSLKKEGVMAIAGKLLEGAQQNGLLGSLNVIGNLVAPSGHGRNVKLTLKKPQPDFSWVDEGNQPVQAQSAAEASAARTKQSVTQRQEGKLTQGMEVLGSMPIEFVKKLKNFTEAAMSMPLGASVQDHPEVADMAASVAFDLMGVGMSTMPLKPGLGIFAGRMSPSAVKAAEKMEKEGFSPISVKEMTGLERGADGFWRRELDDSASKINWSNFRKEPEFLQDASGKPAKNVTMAELGNVLDHPEFFNAYPDAKDVLVILDKATDKRGGYYDHGSEMIVLYGKDSSPEYLREILMHELQHYIQRTEGFNWGSAAEAKQLPKDMRDKIRGYLIRKYGQEKLTVLKEALIQDMNKQNTLGWDITGGMSPQDIASNIISEADYRLYRAVAGETEAWNTQRRLNMTAKERRQSLGRETEDTPRSEQIIHTKDELYLGSQH
jgi:hypothetical protein